MRPAFINEKTVANIEALNAIAGTRGQTLAQTALAWVLRKGRTTSALIGASRPEQVEDCVGALKALDFSDPNWPKSTATRASPASTCGRLRPNGASTDKSGLSVPIPRPCNSWV